MATNAPAAIRNSMPKARAYRGKYPNRIAEVSAICGRPGVVFVRTNDGTAYEATARALSGQLPKCGQDIADFAGFRPYRLALSRTLAALSRIDSGSDQTVSPSLGMNGRDVAAACIVAARRALGRPAPRAAVYAYAATCALQLARDHSGGQDWSEVANAAYALLSARVWPAYRRAEVRALRAKFGASAPSTVTPIRAMELRAETRIAFAATTAAVARGVSNPGAFERYAKARAAFESAFPHFDPLSARTVYRAPARKPEGSLRDDNRARTLEAFRNARERRANAALLAAYRAHRAHKLSNRDMTARTASAALSFARQDVARGWTRGPSRTGLLGHGDVIRARTADGRKVTFAIAHIPDDDMGAPWTEHDGHGVIREVSRNHTKAPGERLFSGNSSGSPTYAYDVQATMALALKDEWGLAPEELAAFAVKLGRKPTRRQIAAEAVRRDFERCRAWVCDEWNWIGVALIEMPRGEELSPSYVAEVRAGGRIGMDSHFPIKASLWGIESDSDPSYFDETARELLREALASC